MSEYHSEGDEVDPAWRHLFPLLSVWMLFLTHSTVSATHCILHDALQMGKD